MLIRTRVILITLGFGISIILGAAVELQLREDTAREQYVQSVVGDRSTLWRKVVDSNMMGFFEYEMASSFLKRHAAPTAPLLKPEPAGRARGPAPKVPPGSI